MRVGAEDAESRVLARLPGRGKPQRRIDPQEFATLREQRLADAIGEQAVAPDADEALGQNVLQEAPAEGGRIELGGLAAVAVRAVTVAEDDGLSVVADQALVGDRDLARVAGEVVDDLLGATERASDVDVPVAAGGVAQQARGRSRGRRSRCCSRKQGLELREQLALEEPAQDLEGDEIAPAVDEALGTQSASGDETVDVRMVALALVPGVEHGEHAGAQAPRRRRLQDRLGDGGEESVEGIGPALAERRTAAVKRAP